jgi:hypothetical protein
MATKLLPPNSVAALPLDPGLSMSSRVGGALLLNACVEEAVA